MEKEAKKNMKEYGVNVTKDTICYDEIQMIRELSCMTALEAMWHIQGFELSQCSHVVTALSVHEEHEEPVLFPEGHEDEAVEKLIGNEATSAFTAWMKLNRVTFSS